MSSQLYCPFTTPKLSPSVSKDPSFSASSIVSPGVLGFTFARLWCIVLESAFVCTSLNLAQNVFSLNFCYVWASPSSTASTSISQCVSLRAPVFLLCYRSCHRRTTALASVFLSVAFCLVYWPLYWPVCWYMSRAVPLLACQPEKRLLPGS